MVRPQWWLIGEFDQLLLLFENWYTVRIEFPTKYTRNAGTPSSYTKLSILKHSRGLCNTFLNVSNEHATSSMARVRTSVVIHIFRFVI